MIRNSAFGEKIISLKRKQFLSANGRFSPSQKVLFIISCLGLVITLISKRVLKIDFSFLSAGLPEFIIENLVYDILIFIWIFIILKVLFTILKSDKAFENSILRFQEKASIYVIFFITTFYLFLILFNPYLTSLWDKEDGPIEWGSFFLLIFGSVIFLISYKNSLDNQNFSKILRWILIIAGLLYFIMAMEEISWGQRIINWKSPELFNANLQNETNIHNFGNPGPTGFMMSGYYLGHFLLFVLLPFLGITFSDLFRNRFLSVLIPKPYFIILGSLTCAFHGIIWNYPIYYRLFLLSSVSILAILFLSKQKVVYKGYFVAAATLIVMAQCIFLIFGKTLTEYNIRLYEFNEFLSQYTLWVYALGVLYNLKSIQTTQQNNKNSYKKHNNHIFSTL